MVCVNRPLVNQRCIVMFRAGWAIYGRCSDIEFAGTNLVGKCVRFIILILSCLGRGPAKGRSGVKIPAEARGGYLPQKCKVRLWGLPSLLFNAYGGTAFVGPPPSHEG